MKGKLLMTLLVRSLLLGGITSLTALACNDENGLSYQSLSFRASEVGVTGTPITRCITLPHLIGSEVDAEIELADGLTAHVLAMRDDVALTFTGSVEAGSASRSVTREQLLDDYEDQLEVSATTSGRHFQVILSSKCAAQKP